jgi:hypothetical protein
MCVSKEMHLAQTVLHPENEDLLADDFTDGDIEWEVVEVNCYIKEREASDSGVVLLYEVNMIALLGVNELEVRSTNGVGDGGRKSGNTIYMYI